jgi:hypothetical protein
MRLRGVARRLSLETAFVWIPRQKNLCLRYLSLCVIIMIVVMGLLIDHSIAVNPHN